MPTDTANSRSACSTTPLCRAGPITPCKPSRTRTRPTMTPMTTDNDTPPPAADPVARGSNFHLAGDRELARGWPARARDNIAAIGLSKMLEQSGRAPTADEQAQLLRFTGFGASELAQNCFRRPGEDEFRPDWQDIGAALEAAVTPEEYAALQRATQYAHYTPETIIRGLWRAAERLGFSGGRVLEPGMGTGLFFALLPVALRDSLPAHRHRIRSGHRPHRAPGASRGAGAVRGLRAEPDWPGASISRSAIRHSPTAWCGPIPSRAPLGCGCTTTSSPVRSPGCAPAASRCSSPAPARWTRPAPRHGSTSPAWPTWWARCACPRAACARRRAPTW